MNDTSSKTQAEAGKDRKTIPDVFRDRTPLDSVFSDFDRAFDALRNNFAQSYLGRSVAGRFDSDWAIAPVVDVIEDDAHYEIKAELPGMDAESVEVKVANGMLTIKGEKKEEKEEKRRIITSPSAASVHSSDPSPYPPALIPIRSSLPTTMAFLP